MPEASCGFERGINGELRARGRTGQPCRMTAPPWKTLPGDYGTWSAEKRLDFLWTERVLKTRYDDPPPLLGAGLMGIVGSVRALSSLAETFDHVSDELPRNRHKVIHTFGSVVRVRWEAVSNDYTGVFRGARGLARLSVAGPPAGIGFTPGMGLKFPISCNQDPGSVDISVMNSVNGQGANENFFLKPFSNLIPPAEGFGLKALEALFQTVKRDSGLLPIAHFAKWEQSGQKVADPRSPHHIVCQPPPDTQKLIPPSSGKDFRRNLEECIPPGTVLYHLYGYPDERQSGPNKLIGELVTESPFVTCWWGDKRLFFRHRR